MYAKGVQGVERKIASEALHAVFAGCFHFDRQDFSACLDDRGLLKSGIAGVKAPRYGHLPALHVFLELGDIESFQFFCGYAIAEQDIVVIHQNVCQFFNEIGS